MTLMMTSALIVETPVNVTSNSPSRDSTHTNDNNLRTYDMTPGFKPFTKGKGVDNAARVTGFEPEQKRMY